MSGSWSQVEQTLDEAYCQWVPQTNVSIKPLISDGSPTLSLTSISLNCTIYTDSISGKTGVPGGKTTAETPRLSSQYYPWSMGKSKLSLSLSNYPSMGELSQ